jgi:DNA-binding NarL/FixJ family response regulator
MKEREQLIAQSHEMIGRIQGVEMIAKMATVSTLIWLRDVKAAKIYKDLPNIGTWDDFCKYLKKDRRTVDEDLQNLATFGEDFLETVASLQVGYRDLRKLRQLTHDGTIQVIDDAIEISGERIPLDADHKEDLQAAIEKVIEEQAVVKEELKAQKKAFDRVQDDTRKSMVKLQKELDKLTDQAAMKELSPEEDAVLQQIDNLHTTFMGYLLQIRTLVDAEDIPGPRAKSALIAFLNQARMELNAYYDTAYDRHAAPGMAPEEEWVPPFERDTALA